MDLTDLMSGRSEAPPSGENLEYDMDFTLLTLAAAPGEERQEGNKIHSAEDPEWPEVKEKALAVLARSHDLRAAGFLAQAAANTDGFDGFAEVVRYFHTVLDQFWDTVHPQLDAEDDNDPTARVNAVQILADNDAMLRHLRAIPLTESRAIGSFGLRELQYATGEVAPPKDVTAPDGAGVSAAFQDTAPEVLNAKFAAVSRSLDHVRGIDAVFARHLPGRGPNLDAVLKLLIQIQKALAPHVDVPVAAAAPAGAEDEAAATAGPAPAAAPAAGSGRQGGGEITTSRDVTVTLDRILAYYERYEPSSPVPLILNRAKRLVGADFMTIMRDLAPQGIDSVTTVSGSEEH